MKSYILNLEKEFSLIENGFKEQESRALADYKAKGAEQCKELALLAYSSKLYQVRMYAVFLFGHLSDREEILTFMRDQVSKDENWRVQEILAKAFDEFCKKVGYEQALFVIDEWLKNGNANAKRAVTEGIRIWTNRPYFKDNPDEAIRRLASLKDSASEYLRKSVGNALKDISKKFPNLVKAELESWNLQSKETLQTYKFASKFIKK
ncbi:DNA alkylation repair protein [Campylobacter concisus]